MVNAFVSIDLASIALLLWCEQRCQLVGLGNNCGVHLCRLLWRKSALQGGVCLGSTYLANVHLITILVLISLLSLAFFLLPPLFFFLSFYSRMNYDTWINGSVASWRTWEFHIFVTQIIPYLRDILVAECLVFQLVRQAFPWLYSWAERGEFYRLNIFQKRLVDWTIQFLNRFQ